VEAEPGGRRERLGRRWRGCGVHEQAVVARRRWGAFRKIATC
jgi:hypothetical protein